VEWIYVIIIIGLMAVFAVFAMSGRQKDKERVMILRMLDRILSCIEALLELPEGYERDWYDK
jgi:pilus assembly protein TadC